MAQIDASPPPRLPNTHKLTIIAQDPSVRVRGAILTARVDVPAEALGPGPGGHRVSVVDYDVTANTLYQPAILETDAEGHIANDLAGAGEADGRRTSAKALNARLLDDPRFHAQNAFAIAMRVLARFEFALGRRVAWGSQGHQLHIVPHAFAEANAFYSREDRGLFFGYFTGRDGKPVFTSLAHDIVAHETTHAILDGLRGRYLEPSLPDQAAFHEGFADIVALLSVFSLKEIVGALLDGTAGGRRLIDSKALTREKLKESVLFGLADEMGQALSVVRGDSLRRSVKLPKGKPYRSMDEFKEEHARGELIVAAVMNAFLDIWLSRIAKVGFIEGSKRDRSIVVEEGARVADHLLTMAIRAIDYCPPTDLDFSDYLSALLTVDREVVPDDTRYGYRQALLDNFAAFDIPPAPDAGPDGAWPGFNKPLNHGRTHFESMLRDKEEVFRFLWENRKALELDERGYIEVQSVRPCIRIGPDGFVLRETVAEYVQILTLETGELKAALGIDPPVGLPRWRRVRLFGGGALIFNEYGQVKYHIANYVARDKSDTQRQAERLQHLVDLGFFDGPQREFSSRFSLIHLNKAIR